MKSRIVIDMTRTKKPKVQMKRMKTSLGWAYRIYIDGHYMGTALTQASAREGAKRMLVNEWPGRRTTSGTKKSQ
jgi:hypothetical protein